MVLHQDIHHVAQPYQELVRVVEFQALYPQLELGLAVDLAVATRDAPQQLLGKEAQAFLLDAFVGTNVGQEAGRRCRHCCAVRVVRSIVDHVAEQVDRDLRIDREGDAEPDPMSECDQRIGLVGLVQYVAGVRGGFPGLFGGEYAERGMCDRPGLVTAFEDLQRTADLQLQGGPLQWRCVLREAVELLAQFDQFAFHLCLLAQLFAQRFGGGVFEFVGFVVFDHDQYLLLNVASSWSSQSPGVSG